MTFESMAGLIEFVFVGALSIGVGIWQVIKMRRELKRDREAAATAVADPGTSRERE
ncbi:MAG TPA: hypothetical protein PK264_05775 [Hyphomicrobiaceae bacterium]|nr:hypothetical protein [Hyphomicrobiaceae bacterium]